MKIRQVNDYETSTRICPCGASITWSGWSDDLDDWMSEHAKHATGFEDETSVDGERAYVVVKP
jgi:hypothetical protein